MPKIVVLGAGVSGLTTALLLARRREHTITVVAKHMPGDYDIEYTSPWAGANVMPMANEPDSRYERDTWPEMKRLATEVPEAGIHFQKALLLRREKDTAAGRVIEMHATNPWFSSLFDDFRELDASERPADVDLAAEYTSVCINTALYLAWLVGQCRAHGVVLKRATLRHIDEAAAMAHTGAGTTADVVINASGLLACRLGGVMDTDVAPIRGQTVLVRDELEPMLSTSGTDDGEDEICYTMMRASGGGTILGGTYQMGNWDGNPDPNQAVRIMARAIACHPQLKGKQVQDLSIIRHGVGLRPYRKGGIRLEKERIGGMWVVHNYGHSGYGYQTSYGCAGRVLEMVAEILAGK